MSEKQQLPKIEHSYSLQGDDETVSSIFLLAGKKYTETRTKDEEVSINFQPRPSTTLVTYGRTVLEVLNRYQFEQASDRMREEIESFVGSLGYQDVAARSYAGRHLSGPIPDQE